MSPALIGAGVALLAYVATGIPAVLHRYHGEAASDEWRARALIAAMTGAGTALITAGFGG